MNSGGESDELELDELGYGTLGEGACLGAVEVEGLVADAEAATGSVEGPEAEAEGSVRLVPLLGKLKVNADCLSIRFSFWSRPSSSRRLVFSAS